ncbi:MAG: hypothetical protein EOO90_03915 [Pedobacter sp.]|nr:MAG: hypothetical protein EOO90_03915 [Pedobacter sp.]
MIRILITITYFLLNLQIAYSATYYCDPVKGNMKNKGTAKSPWSTLDSVFLLGKKLQPGDSIVLRSGYHGFPVVKGNMGGKRYITIVAQSKHIPTVKKILFTAAERWYLSGLKVSPEVVNSYERGDFISIKADASFITVENCQISSTDLCVSDWSAERLLNSSGIGVRVEGRDCTIANNVIKQVLFGISVSKTGLRALVKHNTIYGFLHDGLRGLSDHSIFEYNLVAGSYGIDENHDDGFQSWSTDESGKVGMGKVTGVVLRGNYFISQLDPNQPFPQVQGMQGIGNFDGFFENWLVEDNVILTNMWHGIAFYGAKNCIIRNNTVLPNPLATLPFTPWIAIYDHKKLGASEGNVIKDNIATGFKEMKGVVQKANNLSLSKDKLNSFFVDWGTFNLRLKKKQNVGADLSKLPIINKNLYVCKSSLN